MSPSKPPGTIAPDLRRQAEARALADTAAEGAQLAQVPAETLRAMIFDLRVHQIELELQNEELRRTQVELGQAKSRYFDLYDLAPVGYCTLSPGGTILEANLTLAGLLGQPRSALARRAFSKFIVQEDLGLYHLGLKRLALSGDRQELELRLATRDGGCFWALLEATASRDAGQRTLQYVTVTDITRRKETEGALRDREAQLRSYIDSAPIGIFLTDEEGRLVQVNPAATRVSGYDAAELLAMNISDLMPPRGLEAGLRGFRQVLDQGAWRADVDYRRKGGTRGTVTLDAVRLSPTRLLAFVSDITERKALEKARGALFEIADAALAEPSIAAVLARVHQILATLLPVRNCYVALLDERTGGLTYPYFVDEHRPGPGQRLPGRSFADLVLRTGETVRLGDEDLRALVAAGTVVIAGPLPRTWLGVPLIDEAGPFGVVAVYDYGHEMAYQERDGELLRFVSGQIATSLQRLRAQEDTRKLQAQLLQSQKMESLGRLAGGIAHDMNNVLGAILGMASVQQPLQAAGSPARQAFETIAEAAARGGKVVKGLLHFARQSPAERREVDLNAILLEDVHLLKATVLAKVSLELDLEAELRPIQGDASALITTFMNLLVNAADALPPGGRLRLGTRNLAPGWVEAQVEDQGAGMTQDVLDRAMDPFFTTKETGKGTGLGLAMVYTTVTAHRGHVHLQSAPGQGTRVTLTFPACEPAPRAAAAPAPPPAEPSGGPLHVLVVDDDLLVLKSTEMMVAALGHAARSAPTGEEALALIEGGFRPRLVILDMNMPGLGGGGTLPLLRKLVPDAHVLLATGRADQEALNLVTSFPGVELLPKPFSLDDLRTRLTAPTAK